MLDKLLEGFTQFWSKLYHSDFPFTLTETTKIITAIFLASLILYLLSHFLIHFVKVAKQLSKRLMVIFGILLIVMLILIVINPNRECFFRNEELFLSCQPKIN